MSEGEWKDDADWQDDGLGDDGWDDDNPNQWVDSPVSPSRLAASSKPIPMSGVKNDDSGATASMSWQALLENSSPAFDNPVFDRQNSYEILSSQDLLIKQENMITSVREQLYVNREEAAILLRFYRWKMPTLVDDWLMDADAVRRKVGISEAMDVSEDDVPSTPGGSFTCPLCFDTVSKDKCIGLACGHFFCASCWTSWLSAENEKGPSAIFTTCMAEKCKEIIPEEIQMKLLPKDKKQKFKTWLIDNLIQGNRHLRWCPTPSCHRAVEYKGGGMMEIFCHCGSVFCFKCGYEGHRPADCEIVEKWVQKNSTDAENVNWIIANTKKCPKCNVFIEKNQGCNHMTCRNCKFEFCWLCKGDWTQHGSATGGFYKCNKYDTSKDKDVAAEENKIEEAKNALQKYMFYFTRFDNHDKSIKFAEQTRKKAETTMGKLQDKLGTNYQDVQFLLNAVNAVIACRRVLKWTYCFGYYLSGALEKQIFENHQERLEKFTEDLHGLTERQIDDLLETKIRTQIVNYTRVVEKYKNNVIAAIENGLKD